MMLVQALAATGDIPSNGSSVSSRRNTMLIVEDAQISRMVRTLLEKRGYTAILANAAEAAKLLRAPEAKIGMLLTNVPAIFLEFAARTRLLYLSSAPDPLLAAAFRACRVVRKPFVPSELVDAVSELMGA
jgi:DNA-binding response OmpR family regulator